MSETLWQIEGEGGILESFEDMARQAMREGDLSVGDTVKLIEFRAPTPEDLVCDADSYADDVWEFLNESLYDHEDLSWEEGGASLSPEDFFGPRDPETRMRARIEERPASWHKLKEALIDVFTNNLDLSEAGWFRTGVSRTIRKTSDAGDWEIVDAE